jgi:hypothetical protein
MLVVAVAAAGSSFAADVPKDREITPAVQPGDHHADPTNAALLYWPAWTTFAHFPDLISDYSADPAWRPNDQSVAQIKSVYESIEQLIDASKIPDVDFGIQWSKGFMALLPHLGKLRHSMRILMADALRLQDEGDVEKAGARFAACLRISRHAAMEPTLVDTLVSVSIAEQTCDRINTFIDRGGLTQVTKKEMLDAIAMFDTNDHFRLRAAVRGERRWCVEWMATVGKGPDAGEKIYTEMKPALGEDPSPALQQSVAALRVMNEEAVQQEFQRLRIFYSLAERQIVGLSAATDIPALMARAKGGEFGALFEIVGPALEKASARTNAAAEKLDALRKRLESQQPSH